MSQSEPATGEAPTSPGVSADAKVFLKPREEARILRGHRWVFSNEIDRVEGEPLPGNVVEVLRDDGRLLGQGLYNPNSLIAVRMISDRRTAVDRSFFVTRFRRALLLRKRIYPDYSAFRLVHGESDDLPGLVIDKFDDCIVVQTLCLGMDQAKPLICDALEEVFQPTCIVERNESALREREGLPSRKGILRGALRNPIVIRELDLKFQVDPLEGHKTGFFFDQRENRIFMRRFAPGARVLDGYCHDGGFALHCVKAGASMVLGLDIAGQAIERSRHNALLNGLESRCQFEEIEVSKGMEALRARNERFDVVILDPPSFTRTRKSVPAARRGYDEINRRGIGVLKKGGVLGTACCSFHVTDETFLGCVQEAAFKTGRVLRLLEWRSQAPDHPILPGMPETRYLKFGVFQVD